MCNRLKFFSVFLSRLGREVKIWEGIFEEKFRLLSFTSRGDFFIIWLHAFSSLGILSVTCISGGLCTIDSNYLICRRNVCFGPPTMMGHGVRKRSEI